jgi:hypothetical protein
LWPDARRRLELHEEEVEAEIVDAPPQAETAAMKSAK